MFADPLTWGYGVEYGGPRSHAGDPEAKRADAGAARAASSSSEIRRERIRARASRAGHGGPGSPRRCGGADAGSLAGAGAQERRSRACRANPQSGSRPRREPPRPPTWKARVPAAAPAPSMSVLGERLLAVHDALELAGHPHAFGGAI